MADDATPEDEVLSKTRARLAKVIDMSLDDIEKTLKTGTSTAKAQIIRTTLPALVKVLGDETKDTKLDQMRRDLAEMRKDQRKDIGAGLKERMDTNVTSADGNTMNIPEDDGR